MSEGMVKKRARSVIGGKRRDYEIRWISKRGGAGARNR